MSHRMIGIKTVMNDMLEVHMIRHIAKLFVLINVLMEALAVIIFKCGFCPFNKSFFQLLILVWLPDILIIRRAYSKVKLSSSRKNNFYFVLFNIIAVLGAVVNKIFILNQLRVKRVKTLYAVNAQVLGKVA